MRVRNVDVSTIVGPFVSEAGALGARAPVRLAGHDARAWIVLDGDESLALDEYGELWWTRVHGDIAWIVRPPWPEEIARRRAEIERAIIVLRARASHPARRR